jgi:putative SOS response-associated peptidase YedK
VTVPLVGPVVPFCAWKNASRPPNPNTDHPASGAPTVRVGGTITGMCGRYTLRRGDVSQAIYDAFRQLLDFEFTERPHWWRAARYNIAPSQDVPVIRLNADGKATIGPVQWGLVPSWTRGKPKTRPINARGETVATNGMFRQAYERRRCLLPADGFYEWKRSTDPDGVLVKQPMFIHRQDDALFCFAGLWERWNPDPDADAVDTCTILTTRPNALMSDIHDRMPVILDPADYARWLDRDTPGKDVADLIKPCPTEDLTASPVTNLVNSPKNDDAACIKPLAE